SGNSLSPTRYDPCLPPHLKREKDDGPKEPPDAAGRTAPPAIVHDPRHHDRRRLCVAEGRKLAGRAARPVDPRCGDPRISRGRERLYRGPARAYRRLAETAGEGN